MGTNTQQTIIKSASGRRLYDLLPEVYRTLDREGAAGDTDLAKYLDGCGQLLDMIRQTLEQRLADCFPDNPRQGGLACQPWLLPYFAALLDVRLVSPDDRGRRDEVANGVVWRQGKGTRAVVEQIAENVARTEAEIQEGWQRVVTTPRIGMPLLPATALGEPASLDQHGEHPGWASRHPGLATVTVDLRYPTRAMQVETAGNAFSKNPAAHLSSFAGEKRWWRQVNPHGAPCFPGSYEDVSRRTADLRTPDWQQGHCHPRRALLFVPPPTCFFEMEPENVQDDLELGKDKEHLLQDQVITTLKVKAGSLKLIHCMVKKLIIGDPDAPVTGGGPVLIARDSLIEEAEVHGSARLEYCTVMNDFRCARLQASDSIFAGTVAIDPATETAPHCIRYSRIPAGLSTANLLRYGNSHEMVVFLTFEFDQGSSTVWRQPCFGEPGYGVLHPATAKAIRFGAEDGGEMGAYHRHHYCLLHAAMEEKLKDFLPVTMEAVVISDPMLCRLPIAPCTPQDS